VTGRDKATPPAADPKRGRNPGYAEDHPRDPADARQAAIPSQPTPDEAGIEHDPDAQPDPAKGKR
jgi:hypothetical protein